MTGPRSDPPMPMLTTLRIGLPVCPVQAPLAHAIGEVRHPVEHGVHLGHDVLAVDQDRRAARRAQRHVEHGPFLRDVDLLAAEHGVDAGAQAAVLREADEQRQRVLGDPVLRIIEIDARGLRGQPFAASRIAREQLAQMHGADVPMVLFERLPGRLVGESAGSDSGHDARRRTVADSHRRKPPANALAFLPARHPSAASSVF